MACGFWVSNATISGRHTTKAARLEVLSRQNQDVSMASGFETKIVTVSDGVFNQVREDKSALALRSAVEASGATVVDTKVVPDGIEVLSSVLVDMAEGFNGVIITTGGTGFGPRDLTPEATAAVIERVAPGLAEATRAVNPLGRLSRGVAGTIGSALVLNTPGSPSGAVEAFEAVVDVLGHIVELLAGHTQH